MTDEAQLIVAADRRTRHANRVASLQHLLDLKRAGHSPRHTELRVAKDDRITAQPERRETIAKQRGRA